MPERIFNFAAGPCTLPLQVLKRAREEFVNYEDSGMSLFEMSHRSAIYDDLHMDALRLVREVYELPDSHKVLMLGGGATLQFAMIPMNFLGEGKFAQYVNTGTWSTKALKDARLVGDARELASGEERGFMAVPKDFSVDPKAEYLHITTNNTIKGTQWHNLPETGGVPIFADMSSDFMSRKVDWQKIGLAYGGIQKNLGPAGMALILIRNDILEKTDPKLPSYLRYDLHVSKESIYNTPPMFQVYLMKLVLEWVRDNGGLKEMERRARERSEMIYNAIEEHGSYYRCPVSREDRSRMNVCFRLPSGELEKSFVAEALKRGMSGLKGHRSVGGCRASIYNAMPVEGVRALVEFMVEFMKAHPA